MFLITGGGRGIGRALAQQLAAQGLKVLIVGRTESDLKKTAAFSSHIAYLVADVATEAGQVEIQQAIGTNTLTGLVHNAGIIEPLAPIQTIKPDAFEHIIRINVFAPLRLTQCLLPQLKGGRVLNIGSGAAYFPFVGGSAYCVSKAALAMLTRCFQLEIEDPLFACVMPGIVDTNMVQHIRESKATKPAYHLFHQKLYRDAGLLKPETVALFLSWLLLEVPAARFVSEWDIYDTSHHPSWLKPNHVVPHWDL